MTSRRSPSPWRAGLLSAAAVGLCVHVSGCASSLRDSEQTPAKQAPDEDQLIVERPLAGPLEASEGEVLRSEAFPGLWLDCRAFLEGDVAGVLTRLQEGTRSPEHGAFLADLQRRRRPEGTG